MMAQATEASPSTLIRDAGDVALHREAATFVAAGAIIILLAHAVEVAVSGAPNWPALGIRVTWCVTLLAVASMLRTGGTDSARKGAGIGIFSSAVLDLALLWVTGRSESPLLFFTPVLAMVLPFMAFDALAVGLIGSALLLVGTALLLLADRAPLRSYLVLANAGGGALACAWLLGRAFARARQTEIRRRHELAMAMASIKTLKGLLPLCAWCRRVRSDAGYWQQIESYIAANSEATFTHGVCHDCEQKLLADLGDQPVGPTR